jgi:hypothetical protein
METKRQNPILPADIVVLFLALLVFLLVSRKGETGVSHPQPATCNAGSLKHIRPRGSGENHYGLIRQTISAPFAYRAVLAR